MHFRHKLHYGLWTNSHALSRQGTGAALLPSFTADDLLALAWVELIQGGNIFPSLTEGTVPCNQCKCEDR